MKGFQVLSVIVVALGFGWYSITHSTGDWVITVATPGTGEISECYKMTGTMLRTDLVEGTISWQLGSRSVTFAKGAIAPFRVKDHQWESTFSRAGIDGELCTNGPYPDRDVLARRAMREAGEATRDSAKEAVKTFQKAGDALRDLFQKK